MNSDNYYLITALEDLSGIDADATMTGVELLESLRDNTAAWEQVRAILLSDDILQREAVLAGEIEKVSGNVLSESQIRNEEPLPEYLLEEAIKDTGRAGTDLLWQEYYGYVRSVASATGSNFLERWVGFEVSLRNALVEARAKALKLSAEGYRVAEALGECDVDFNSVLGEWSAAADPLAGMQVLDKARWNWLIDNDAWFSFDNDELAAYAAKLMLVQRRQRMNTAQNQV